MIYYFLNIILRSLWGEKDRRNEFMGRYVGGVMRCFLGVIRILSEDKQSNRSPVSRVGSQSSQIRNYITKRLKNKKLGSTCVYKSEGQQMKRDELR